ncbi:type II toxin-antitoxin system prevent-host-death family antitoxin [Ideonella sp.]|jgi:prevent-host-death family protein|uniref:type II toxin-antitoxin system prevent-host-death family antitoxin n=1 Tax=Ideonella sp. TaxID=1929293 RepID=UPI0037BE946F
MARITSIPAREFARNLAGAKRAAAQGPVLITDRGEPAYALLRIDDYYRLSGGRPSSRSLLEVMDGLPDTTGIDFEPARLKGEVAAADLE